MPTREEGLARRYERLHGLALRYQGTAWEDRAYDLASVTFEQLMAVKGVPMRRYFEYSGGRFRRVDRTEWADYMGA